MKLNVRSALAATILILCGSCLHSPASAQIRHQRLVLMMMPLMRFVPAVTFDGQTVLSYSGSLYNIPARSSTLFVNQWFKTSTAPGRNFQANLLVADTTNVPDDYLAAILLTQYPDGVKVLFYAGCPDPAQQSWYQGLSQESIPLDDEWHVLTTDVVANGASTPTIRIKLDNAPLTISVTENGRNRCAFDWTTVTTWSISGDASAPAPQLTYTGDMAEVYADMTGALTVADSDKFVTVIPGAGPRALGLGFNCEGPTGNIPQLCLRGNAGYFPLGPVGMGPFPPYGFELNEGGTLRTAKSDPCSVRRYGVGCWPTE